VKSHGVWKLQTEEESSEEGCQEEGCQEEKEVIVP
jgi:hypothetical protein